MTTRASVGSVGVEGNARSGGTATGINDAVDVSDDGRRVIFTSLATNLVAPTPTGGRNHVYLRDLSTETTTMVDVALGGGESNNDSGSFAVISGNGRFGLFASTADDLVGGVNLSATDTNGAGDVFIHDRQTGTTQCASLNFAGTDTGNARSFFGAGHNVSEDGNLVVFESDATDLLAPGVDTNGVRDIFLRDLTAGTTTRLSLEAGGSQLTVASSTPSISGDGRFVCFRTAAAILPEDVNGFTDVYVFDRTRNSFVRITVDAAGAQSNTNTGEPFISRDGRWVQNQMSDSNLVPGDDNALRDVFVLPNRGFE